MQSDNAAVYWLILATSISSVTTAVLYFLQRSCGEFWGNACSVCFQKFASLLDLREETFQQVPNLWIFPRIFEQLQLRSSPPVRHLPTWCMVYLVPLSSPPPGHGCC